MELTKSMFASSADYWENEAKRYAGNADYWREKAQAAEADAERYRWLRDKATTGRAVQLVQWMPGEMDAKVDDAMRVTGAVG